MEQIKIDNFYQEYPSEQFPDYCSLDNTDCDDVRKRLSLKLKLDGTVSPIELVKEVDKRGEIHSEINLKNEKGNLGTALSSFGVKEPEYVFINWYRYDEIDKMRFSDVKKFFYDLWYAGSDDLDIFDATLSWILSVDHEGAVKMLKM